ncbi:sensor histidine kinase [Parvicella tangerina]|nr:histidine kinase [Parvicella tangerina]
MLLRNFIYILLFVLLGIKSAAQSACNSYSFNDLYGFEENTIYDIVQNQDGDFWIGTNSGLVYFDGHEFEYYSVKGYGKACSNIKVDPLGRVWYANFGGQLFYLENDSIYTALEQPNSPQLIVDYFPVGQDEVYYFLAESGILHHHHIGQKQTKEFWKQDGCTRIVSGKVVDYEMELVTHQVIPATQQEEIVRFTLNLSNGTFVRKLLGLVAETPSKNQVISTADACYYTYFKSDRLGVLNLDREDALLIEMGEVYSLNTTQVIDNEFFLLKKNGVEAVAIDSPNNRETIIRNVNASTCLKDREGNVWIGTLENGIYIIPNRTFQHNTISQQGLRAAVVTNQGTMYYVDVNNDFYACDFPYHKQELIAENIDFQGFLNYDPINDLVLFNNQEEAYSVKEKKFVVSKLGYFKNAQFIDDNHVVLTRADVAMLATFDRSPIDWKEVVYQLKSSQASSSDVPHRYVIRNVRCNKVVQTRDAQQLYIDYIDGVYYYSTSDEPVVLKQQGQPVIATALMTDTEVGVWIATNNSELLKFEGGQLITSYKLPATVSSIAQNKDLIYLAGKNEIYRLHIPTATVNVIDETDGLLSGKVMMMFCEADSLFLLTENQFQFLNCNYDFINNRPPELFIEEIRLLDKRLPLKDHYDLAYNENSLTFSFRTNAIRGKEQISYEYRISGGDWLTAPRSSNEVRLSNLAPGTYIFELRTINEDGVTSEVKRISFIIDKHLLDKWWFWLVIFSVILIIAAVVAKYRYSELRRQNELKQQKQELQKEVYKSKIAAIRSQMNPHFIFNLLNSIQHLVIKGDNENAYSYINRFAGLVRNTLDYSEEDTISLREEIKLLDIYLDLEKLRFPESFTYEILEMNTRDIQIPPMLIQPFIENALVHGLLHKNGQKRLRVQFELKEVLICRVEDNGIGRKKAKEIRARQRGNHKSFSTLAIENRFELLAKSYHQQIGFSYEDLNAENEEEFTTRVTIRIPYR